MRAQKLIAFFGLFMLFSGAAAAGDLAAKWNYGMDSINISAKAVVLAVNVADYDGDGFNDIAVGAKEDTLQGLSAGWVYVLKNDGTLEWKHDTLGAVSAMISADLSGEGRPQIIAGVSSSIFIFSGDGNYKQFRLGDLTYKVAAMAVDDINNDGANELVIAAGSQDKGKVFILNKNGRSMYSQATRGSPEAMVLSDINGDGEKEIIVGTVGRDDEYPAYVQAYTSKAGKLWEDYKTKKGVKSLAVADTDGDGSDEILAGSTDSLYILSPQGKEEGINSNITRPGYVFNRILVTDMDGDGSDEVVFGCTNSVYMYDESLRSLRWKNTVGTEVFDLVAQDIDGDNLKDLLVASDILYIFNKDGTQINSFDAGTNRFSVRDICIDDLNEDTYPDILIGATDGRVYVLSSQTQAKRIEANNLYRRGKQQYEERNYADAEASIRAAIKIYKDLGDNTNAYEMDNLLKRIMNDEARVANQTGEAQRYLESAFDAFESEDYLKAVEDGRIARSKYVNINPKDIHINQLDRMINSSMETIRLKAEGCLENASAYADKKDYRNALEYAKKAEELFSFLKDDPDTEKSRGIINQSKEALGVTYETPAGESPGQPVNLSGLLPVLGIAVVIIVIAAVYVVLIKKKGKRGKDKKRGLGNKNLQNQAEKKEAKTHKREGEHTISGHSGQYNVDQHRDWMREVEEAIEESRRQEQTRIQTENEPHSARRRHRKTLERITKDSYRGVGLSLRNVSHDAEN